MRTRFAALLIFLGCSPLYSADFAVGPFLIEMPAKFQGPITTKSEAQLHAYSFSIPRMSAGLSTGLQIVFQETGLRGSQMSEAELIETSRRYLANMLAAVERHRTEFRKGEPATVKLADMPASEVAWTGRMAGFMNNGRLFCIATGSDILFLHVMGAGAVPDEDMTAAISAVMAMRRRAKG
jgi:hypothetical protein